MYDRQLVKPDFWQPKSSNNSKVRPHNNYILLLIFSAYFIHLAEFSSVLGLCNDSLNQVMKDMPPPTIEDLQGFWEMVCLQVENVDALFAELERTRENDWKVSIFLKCTDSESSNIADDSILSYFFAINLETKSGTTKIISREQIKQATNCIERIQCGKKISRCHCSC